MKKLIVLSILFVIPSITTAVLLAPGASIEKNIAPESSNEALALRAFSERNNPLKALEALNRYEDLMRENPKTEEYYWMAAEAAWWLGDQAEKDKDKLNYFQKGIDLANKGIEIDPDSAGSHFWLAGNYGSFGETKGILKSLSLVKPIRAELNEVLRINPEFDGGGAYRVLGVLDYKIPGFAGGDKERALVQLMKSYEMDPHNPASLFYLGEYFKVIKDEEKAIEYLEKLENLDTSLADPATLANMQTKGNALLKKLRK